MCTPEEYLLCYNDSNYIAFLIRCTQFINSPWQIGSLTLPHRLIQGPLAGYSCAPFRSLFNQYTRRLLCKRNDLRR